MNVMVVVLGTYFNFAVSNAILFGFGFVFFGYRVPWRRVGTVALFTAVVFTALRMVPSFFPLNVVYTLTVSLLISIAIFRLCTGSTIVTAAFISIMGFSVMVLFDVTYTYITVRALGVFPEVADHLSGVLPFMFLLPIAGTVLVVLDRQGDKQAPDKNSVAGTFTIASVDEEVIGLKLLPVGLCATLGVLVNAAATTGFLVRHGLLTPFFFILMMIVLYLVHNMAMPIHRERLLRLLKYLDHIVFFPITVAIVYFSTNPFVLSLLFVPYIVVNTVKPGFRHSTVAVVLSSVSVVVMAWIAPVPEDLASYYGIDIAVLTVFVFLMTHLLVNGFFLDSVRRSIVTATLDSFPEAVFVIDTDMRIVSLNRTAANLAGSADVGVLTGIPVIDLIREKDTWTREMDRIATLHGPISINITLLLPGRSPIPFEGSFSRVIDEFNDCTAFLLSGHPSCQSGAEPLIAEQFGLTARETDILCLVVKGYSNQMITENLFISLPTVKTHLSSIFRKLGVRSRHQLTQIVMGKTEQRDSSEMPLDFVKEKARIV